MARFIAPPGKILVTGLLLKFYTKFYIYNFSYILYQFLETGTLERTLMGLDSFLKFVGLSLSPFHFSFTVPLKPNEIVGSVLKMTKMRTEKNFFPLHKEREKMVDLAIFLVFKKIYKLASSLPRLLSKPTPLGFNETSYCPKIKIPIILSSTKLFIFNIFYFV